MQPNYLLKIASLSFIEDISSFDEAEEEALIAANIVPKMVSLFSFVTGSIIGAFNRGAGASEFEVCLYKKCVVILGNMA